MKKTAILYDALYNDVTQLTKDISLLANKKIQAYESNLQRAAAIANSVSPIKVIARGYAVVQKQDNTVTSVNALNIGDNLNIKMRDGNVLCNVNSITEDK